jgi:uncharacterized integral membrane protein
MMGTAKAPAASRGTRRVALRDARPRRGERHDVAESRADRLVREARFDQHARSSRRAFLYAWAAVLVAILSLLIALVAGATRSVRLDWLVGSTTAPLVSVVVGATALGRLRGLIASVLFRRRARGPARTTPTRKV